MGLTITVVCTLYLTKDKWLPCHQAVRELRRQGLQRTQKKTDNHEKNIKRIEDVGEKYEKKIERVEEEQQGKITEEVIKTKAKMRELKQAYKKETKKYGTSKPRLRKFVEEQNKLLFQLKDYAQESVLDTYEKVGEIEQDIKVDLEAKSSNKDRV